MPSSIDLIIEAKWIIPVEPANLVLENHSIAIDRGRIVAILQQSEAKSQFTPKEIKKLPWGGRDPVLDTPEKQLFFTLFYLKTYPTFDVLGFHFGLSAGHARDYLVFFLRVMNLSLTTLKTLPVRHLGQVEDFKQVTDNDKEIIIDGIEVPCVRPGDPEQQKTRYSGKKKGICSRC